MRLLLIALLLPLASSAARVEVPVDVGIGPAAYWFFGPLVQHRGAMPHFGLKLNVKAVLDQEWLERNRDVIPMRYRKMAEGVSEVRFSPSILIPDALIVSPKLDQLDGTGIYGVTWRPFSLGIPLTARKRAGAWQPSRGRIDFELGLLFTYAYIHSSFAAIPDTHFVRPGIDAMLEMELMVTKSFLLSVGWASQLYVPQKLGTFGLGPLEESIFHVGQAFLKVHFRFPYRTSL